MAEILPSHLLQMRGLKPFEFDENGHTKESHLLQMRGLKPHDQYAALYVKKSHLLQMRGLKHCLRDCLFPDLRRIFYRCVD